MSDQSRDAARERTRVIDGFAVRLREVRAAAGNPSFREMAGRSKAISHTTLHEAAQGHRLPSWATVVEFVKACGGDPEDLRPDWEQADRELRTVSVESADPASAAGAATTAEPAEAVPPRQRRRLFVALGGAAAVLAVAAIVLVLALSGGNDPATGRAAAATTAANPLASSSPTAQARRYTAADCPVKQKQPPLVPATRRGDKADFIGDITVPDCAHFPRGRTFTKIWRFKNEGSVQWDGYTMRRLGSANGRGDCQTIASIPVPDTDPGKEVDVSVQVTAPSSPGFCYARYRIVLPDGADAFPGGRSITFQAIID